MSHDNAQPADAPADPRQLTDAEMLDEAAASDDPADTIAQAIFGGRYFPGGQR